MGEHKNTSGTEALAILLSMAINVLLLWWVWDTWLVVVLKGVPSIDGWGALLIMFIGNILSTRYGSSKDE